MSELNKSLFSTLADSVILENEPLYKYTTYRIGGPADIFIKVSKKESLINCINICRENNYPFFILGGGSNILINDNGIRGVVILDRTSEFKMDKDTVQTDSGVLLKNIAFKTAHSGYAGLEFGCSIYGTVGGAVYGNAGAYGKSVGDVLIEADVILSDGTIQKVDKTFFDFNYRSSSLKINNAVLLSAVFKLSPADPAELILKVKEDIDRRIERHPLKEGSAGSYFKNLPPLNPGKRRISAGKILDEVGAKGMSFGNAYVYEKHANFIVNPGNATCREIRALADLLKAKIKKEKNIILEEEVIYVPEIIS